MERKGSLLLVANSEKDRTELRRIFQDKYNLLEAANREQALFLLKKNGGAVLAIVADTVVSSENIKTRQDEDLLHRIYPDIPVMLLLDTDDPEDEVLAYEMGASDVMRKPYHPLILVRRVQTLTELYLQKQNLSGMISMQTAKLRSASEKMIDALTAVIEYRNATSGGHILRIRHFTRILLEDVARSCPEYGLHSKEIQLISSASALHDIGKISVPGHILNKPSGLSEAEMEIMKKHTSDGSRILEALTGTVDPEYLQYARDICLCHHERWDGSGYPKGLRGDEIPICAQAAGLADTYEALTSDRADRAACSHHAAVNMILNGECGAFSPQLLECFKNVREQFAQPASAFYSLETAPEMFSPVSVPFPDNPADAFSGSDRLQSKYQSLLNYMDSLVVEADLRSGEYHLVYNPYPDFFTSFSKKSFQDALADVLQFSVHPDDRIRADQLIDRCCAQLGVQGQRKFRTHCRIYLPSLDAYQMFNVTFLRIDSDHPDFFTVMIICTPAEGSMEKSSFSGTDGKAEDILQLPKEREYEFSSLMGSMLRCRNDKWFTVEEGAENLHFLLGYTKEEIMKDYQGRLLNLILPEDRESVDAQVRRQLLSSNMLELEYRMRSRDGSVIWVLEKSRLHTAENGMEYLYVSLINNTRGRSIQNQLQQLLEKYQIIIDQMDHIVFEWDIQNDTVFCSSRWEQQFGYQPLSEHFSRDVFSASHLHPDDLPVLRDALHKVRMGEMKVELEVRILNADGKYIWSLIRGTTQKDQSGTPIKVIGIISDIDKSKRTAIHLQKKAELDSLTGLYNKDAVHRHISQALSCREGAGRSALLMIDLDNFKGINDTYGHLFGDTVLAHAADEIRRLFRPNDIIGRVGGDEFIVYMCSVTDEKLVENRCRRLIEATRTMLSGKMPECYTSCSVGAALIPDHGTSYLDLYVKADRALYHAKNLGKNTCFLYDANLLSGSGFQNPVISCPIDSDERNELSEQAGQSEQDAQRGQDEQRGQDAQASSVPPVICLTGQSS